MFLVTAYSLKLNFEGDGYSTTESTIFIKTTLGNHKQQDVIITSDVIGQTTDMVG